MPAPTKPGIPWDEVGERYRTGETATDLAREYDVTRQGIEKRAKKEGWDKEHRLAKLRAQAVATIVPAERLPQDRYGLRTQENAEIVVAMAMQGLPHTVQAARIGMSSSALTKWKEDNPDLADAINEGYAIHAAQRAANVNEASERGDARAAQWLLERNPLTRADYGQSQDKSGPTLNVIINVPREADVQTIEGEIIEAGETG